MRQALLTATFAGLLAFSEAAKPSHTFDAQVKSKLSRRAKETKNASLLTSSLGHEVIETTDVRNYNDMMITADVKFGS